MTKWILGALAALTMIVPAAAQAHTVISEPIGSHFPYQRWIDESLMPTPDATITVVEAACPGAAGDPTGCTSPTEGLVWMNVGRIETSREWPREVFLHEIGHDFGADDLGEWGRDRFREITGSDLPWSGEGVKEGGLEEVFAEDFMSCSLRVPASFFRGRVRGEYDPRACHLIRSASRQQAS